MELVANNFSLSSTTVTGIPMKVLIVLNGRRQFLTVAGKERK